MPLIFNGVTIPEDVANALKFNGTDIETVIFNGVEVWKQSLFFAVWSGSSLVNSGSEGLLVSGSNFKAKASSSGWLSAFTDGTFTNGSSDTGLAQYTGFAVGSGTFNGSPNSTYLTACGTNNSGKPNWSLTGVSTVSYTIGVGFTKTGSDPSSLEVSTGQLRVSHGSSKGAWITLN